VLLSELTLRGIQIAGSITKIIHNGMLRVLLRRSSGSLREMFFAAWRVGFNVSLSAFEPLISSLATFLNLAVQSPVANGARVIFVSSVSVFASMYYK
jgi:hypothetical protein